MCTYQNHNDCSKGGPAMILFSPYIFDIGAFV